MYLDNLELLWEVFIPNAPPKPWNYLFILQGWAVVNSAICLIKYAFYFILEELADKKFKQTTDKIFF